MDSAQKQLAQELVKARKQKNISQRELARQAHTTQAVISRVENLEVNPSIGLIERLSLALGTNLQIQTNPTIEKIKHKLSGRYHTLNNISISAAALQHNYAYFAKLHPQKQIAPVLKSNAYGHGITQIGEWVSKNTNAPFVCVDSLHEAYQLRNANVHIPVLVMGYTDPRNFKVFKDLSDIHFSLFDLESARALKKYQPSAQVQIKIDTGMNRLGVYPQDLNQFIQSLKPLSLDIIGVFSHLSQADTYPNQHTQAQLAQFHQSINILRKHRIMPKYRHISATAGALTQEDPDSNLIRLGIGFYGYDPLPKGKPKYHPLQPALSLTSTIAQIKQVGEGRPISYGESYVTNKNTTIAIAPIGYHDGVSRRLSNKSIVIINDTYCPIVGNITMNQAIIDVTHLNQVRVGETITFISPDLDHPNNIYQLASFQNTIPYTVLTALSPTTKRQILP